MLRDLVKPAKRKYYKEAKMEVGGIKVNGALYTPDNFKELPDVIKLK